ncbi:MAG TPA: sigma-54 dependent transcriptional regulator [Bryobacteraceae bacterium]|jgi:two-component system nitrogen regulation response regulator NtrX
MPGHEARILIVDDEVNIRHTLRGVLADENYDSTAVATGEACLDALNHDTYDAVLLDIWLPGIDGLETLQRIQEIAAETRPSVIMISGHGNIETAVKATKLGAFDFVEKPLTIEKVSVALKNALQQRRMDQELQRLREDTSAPELIGESVAVKALRQQLKLMAGTNGRVLIYGESGTGKELVARALHKMSTRAEGPFVEVNCAAIPEDLIESELFGYRRTNLNGTADHKIGKLQKAHGGTFFLDEVGDMSLKTQSKLLRALDEHRFEPVGAPQSIQADARVVAATNKNLEKEIERGNFREDLFYRLNVIPFTVPPLRDRIEDIPLLASHFLREFATAYGRRPKELSEEAVEALGRYSWPGNVRELRNLMERMVILHGPRRIEVRHLPLDSVRKAQLTRSEGFGSLQDVKEAAEREYILRKLDETGGNVTRAAELLGLERSNLYRKMRALGIASRESLP